jgi:hypothetical protein
VINLSEWTQERLNALAATTAPKDPFSALLKVPPSAPKDRLGRFTGQQHREKIKQNIQPAQFTQFNTAAVPVRKDKEKKREKKVVSVAAPGPFPQTAHQGGADAAPVVRNKKLKDNIITTLHKYLSVGVDVPWSLLGRKNPMVAAGIEIRVLCFWRVVQEFGGYSRVCNRKLWSAVGRELGVNTQTFHSIHMFRDTYSQYLLPYEVFLRHQREEEEEERTTIGRQE